MQAQKQSLAVNDRGVRVGDSHHNAKLTNAEVDRLLHLRDQGWSYLQLAHVFEISKSGARMICKALRRCQVPARYKLVEVRETFCPLPDGFWDRIGSP